MWDKEVSEVEKLQNEDVEVRLRATRLLQISPDPLALEPLIWLATSDTDWQVRYQAITALGVLGDRRCVEPLIEIFKGSEGKKLRKACAHTLSKFSDNSVSQVLLSGLSDTSTEIRSTVISALGQLKDKSLLPRLLEIMKTDPQSDLRLSAVLAVSNLGGDEVLEDLFEVIQSDEFWTPRYWAAIALIKRGDLRGVNYLTRELDNGIIAWSAYDMLTEVVSPLLAQPLIEVLEEASPEKLYYVLQLLAQLKDPSATPPLLKLLEEQYPLKLAEEDEFSDFDRWDDDDFEEEDESEDEVESENVMRTQIIEVLGKLGNQIAQPALREVLNNPSEPKLTRMQAALALTRLGEKETFDIFLELLGNAARSYTSIIMGLGDIRNNPKLTGFLIKCLKTGHFELREAAATALGNLGNKTAVEELIKVYRNTNQLDQVRKKAALALAKLMDERANSSLLDATKYFKASLDIFNGGFPRDEDELFQAILLYFAKVGTEEALPFLEKVVYSYPSSFKGTVDYRKLAQEGINQIKERSVKKRG